MARNRFRESSKSRPKNQTGEESNPLAETETSSDSFDITVEQPANDPRDRDEHTRKGTVSRVKPNASGAEPAKERSSDRTGKVAAIITVVVLLAGIVALGIVVISHRNSAPLKIESVVESVDATNGCEWQLAIEVLNNTDQPLIVERIAAVLNRGQRSNSMQQIPLVAPGEVGTFLVAFRLPAGEDCPAVDEINHGNLIFHLRGGSSESVRF